MGKASHRLAPWTSIPNFRTEKSKISEIIKDNFAMILYVQMGKIVHTKKTPKPRPTKNTCLTNFSWKVTRKLGNLFG